MQAAHPEYFALSSTETPHWNSKETSLILDENRIYQMISAGPRNQIKELSSFHQTSLIQGRPVKIRGLNSNKNLSNLMA